MKHERVDFEVALEISDSHFYFFFLQQDCPDALLSRDHTILWIGLKELHSLLPSALNQRTSLPPVNCCVHSDWSRSVGSMAATLSSSCVAADGSEWDAFEIRWSSAGTAASEVQTPLRGHVKWIDKGKGDCRVNANSPKWEGWERTQQTIERNEKKKEEKKGEKLAGKSDREIISKRESDGVWD